MAQTYHIATIQDLLKVPPDRRRACFEEIELALLVLELLADGHPVKLLDGFAWRDDGDKSQDLSINGEDFRLEIRKEAPHAVT